MIRRRLYANVLKRLRRWRYKRPWVEKLHDYILVRVRSDPVMGLHELTRTEGNTILEHGRTEWPPGPETTPEELRNWPDREVRTREGVLIGRIQTLVPTEEQMGFDYNE